MGLKKRSRTHVGEPAVLRVLQWRGDPVARLMLPATKADPYPLYARVGQRGLVRSPLGGVAAADHATVAGPGRPAGRAPRRAPALEGPPRPPPAAPAGDRRVLPENHCRARAVDPRGYG